MQGTIQNYTLDMADGTAPKPLIVKQGDTNSRQARISLKAFDQPWTIPFGCQIQINVRKNDGTYANATCNQEDEHTVLAPITEQMTAVPGTQLGELFFLDTDGDIRSQTFPLVVWDAVSDLDLMASSDDFQALKDALRDVKTSTEAADRATQYATEQGNSARDMAQRAENAAESIQAAVDAAAAAKACESNAKDSEIAAAQTQQAVTDYVESQKAAFVGYSKRESDSQYANALTETATGEGGVTVEDAWTAPVLGLDVAGRSEQVTTTGAQLFDASRIATMSGGGATVTNNGDGSFTVSGSGTLTSVCQKSYALTHDESIRLFPAGVYTMTRSPAYPYCYVQANRSGSSSGTLVSTDSENITITEAMIADITYRITIGFYGASGKAIVPGIIKPMVNAGDTLKPYEPYTGGEPSPSPDYPQDIISTGTVSTGKNLFDVTKAATLTNHGSIDKIVKDEIYFIASGDDPFFGDARSAGSKYQLQYGQMQPIKGATRIRLIVTNKWFNKNYITFWDVNGVSLGFGTTINAVEVPDDAVAYTIRCGHEGASTQTQSTKIQVQYDSDNTTWEPYTGGKPAPSVEYPQTLEVGVTGANLLQVNPQSETNGGVNFVVQDGEITLNGTASEDRGIFLLGNSFTGDKTCLTLKDGSYSAGGYPKNTRLFLYRVSNTASAFVVTSGSTFEIGNDPGAHTGNDLVSVSLRWEKGAVFNNEKFRIMFNAGTVLLPWEPYRTATAPITLTEPLRGIGDYRDRIMCREGVWGIERQCLQDNITSVDAAQNLYFVKNVEAHRFKPCDWTVAANAICDHLTVVPYNDRKDNCIALRSTSNQDGWAYCLCIESIDQTIAAYNAWLAEHVVSVVAILSTPTWEPLPDATQQALNELTTYAGTTHLTITAGGTTPTVTLDYVQDTHKAFERCKEATKEYTDNQIAAIVAALPTATQAAIVDNQTTKLLQEV